ncbi:DUF397 domain-containing protein [Thermomonospora sp. CIF 1]|uniref:DUF397 domain-containing protein n=1 Tax=Thermomonospora sp. CIF 1 TaxID=1916083 RepID=UPI000CB200E8|nr:DUF397 domain-containing protein [Thermomonospora sp. CIF 1]PKK15291.1 MAG: DUF397 domain-containing protein [Thermomonospora sp. CIF 1]
MIQWRKSSYSGGLNDDACVELARFPGGIVIRDSKHPEGCRLEVPREAFAALLAQMKRGELGR